MTVQQIQKRQDEIIALFTVEQQALIHEAINIEYKLAMIEQGYRPEDIEE